MAASKGDENIRAFSSMVVMSSLANLGRLADPSSGSFAKWDSMNLSLWSGGTWRPVVSSYRSMGIDWNGLCFVPRRASLELRILSSRRERCCAFLAEANASLRSLLACLLAGSRSFLAARSDANESDMLPRPEWLDAVLAATAIGSRIWDDRAASLAGTSSGVQRETFVGLRSNSRFWEEDEVSSE
eukprot:Lithocolla_globosa_v1_NODE_778_length_3290_cov_24.418547.p3 type:complete len:186 gc:universal NODE_778_length_3290_cov_24.418547:2206-2763(+)